MANEIQLPVKLYIENLQSIVKDMKGQLSSLKVDSTGYRNLSKVIQDIEKRIESLQVQSSRPFVNAKQFTDVEKEISHIQDDLTKIGLEAGKIKFSDLQLDASQKAKLQEFDAQIKSLNDQLKNMKESAKNTFLETDVGKMWKDAHPEAVTQSFEQITKAINKEVQNQQKALEQAKQAYEDYKNTIAASKSINTFMSKKQGHQLSEVSMGKELYDQIFSGEGDKLRFKNGGRSLLQEWLEQQFKFDSSTAQKLVSGTAKEVKAAFEQVNGEVEAALKKQKVELGDRASEARTQSNNGRTYTQDITEKDARMQALQQTQNGVVQSNMAVRKSEQEVQNQLEQAKGAREQYTQSLVDGARGYLTMGQASSAAKQQLASLQQTVDIGKQKLANLDKSVSKLQGISNFVNRYVGAYAIIRKISTAIRNAFTNIKELDKVITNIAVVTNMSQNDLWNKVGEYTQIAQQYGVMTKDVYTVSQLFYQQGLQTSQVMELTTETLKMAKIAGMDYTAATNAMTVAVRAFNIEMTEAQQVTDTYSALAAKFAVSSAEIANAMEKTASSAASVGMSLQSTSAFISVMEQTTRESAQNIGSALKSIISRYGEMKASPDKLLNVEGEDVAFNKTDTALKSIGISIKDVNGQFRDFDDVIMELASKWNTLDNNTQRYIATIMAGNRQQSRFIALVSNYDELKRAMTTANDAENASIVQVGKTLDSLESKTNQLKNAWQQLYLSLHIENGLKGTYDMLTRILQTIGKLGMKNGVLPTLMNLVGFGTGIKSLVKIGQDSITARKSKIGLDTTEAENQIKTINEEIEKQRTMPITTKVDDTELKNAEQRAQALVVTASGNSGGIPAPSSSLVGYLTRSNPGMTAEQATMTLQNALRSGQLATPVGQKKFADDHNIPEEVQEGKTGALSELENLAGAARNAASNLTNVGASGQNASNGLQQAAQGGTEAGVAEQSKVSAAVEAAQADYNKALADRNAAQEALNTARTNSESAQAALDAAEGNRALSASEKERLADAAANRALEVESAKSALQKSEADRRAAEAALRKAQSDEQGANAGHNEAEASDEAARADRREADASDAAAKKTSGALMKGIGLASAAARIAGTAITAAGAAHQDKSTDSIETSKLLTGLGNGVSMAGTGASMGMAAGPWGALIGGVAGFLIGGVGSIIDALNFTIAEKIDLARQEAETLKNESLKTQAKVIDTKSSIDNIKQLQKAMYNSTEDMKAYKDAMNTLAQEYPDLISSYDDQGNAIINLSEAERKLAELRKESAVAAREAAIAETKQNQLELMGYQDIKKMIEEQSTTNTDHKDRYQEGLWGDVAEIAANGLAAFGGPQGTWALNNFVTHPQSGDIHGLSTWDRMWTAILPGGISSSTNKNNISNIFNEKGEVTPILESTRFSYGNLLGEVGYGTIDYKSIIESYAADSAEYKDKLKEGLTYEDYIAIATILKNDSALSDKYSKGHKRGMTGELLATTEEWDYYISSNQDTGYEYHIDDINKKLKEYTNLFGKEIDVISLLGESVGKTVDADELTKIMDIINNKIRQQNKKIANSRKEAGMSAAEESLLDNALDQLNVTDNSELGDNKVYSKIFYRMLEQRKGKYTDVYEFYDKDYRAYSEAVDEMSQRLFNWFKGLSQSAKEFLYSIDYTEYLNIDDIARKLNLKEGTEEYQAILAEFVENNEANKTRILEAVYDTDKYGRKSGLNESLNGLKKIANYSVEYNDSYGGIDVQTRNRAMDIADLIDNNEVISKYADYFTTELININNIAEEGYERLASSRFTALYALANELSEIDDSKVQADLFSIITQIDFSNYDTLVKASQNLDAYVQKNGDSTQLSNIWDILYDAMNDLVFNVNTLSQNLVDSVTAASKEVNNIMASSKSGFDMSKAFEELEKINISKDLEHRLTFNQAFNYDALAGKYVYSIEGIQAAIEQNDENLDREADQLKHTADLYKKYTDAYGKKFIEGSYNNDKHDPKKIIENTEGFEDWDTDEQNLYEQLATNFLKSSDYVNYTWQDWKDYLSKQNLEAEKQAIYAQQYKEAYDKNKYQSYFQNVDWAKIALGTDYTGINEFSANLMIEALNDATDLTLDAISGSNWEEILDTVLNEMYNGNEKAIRAAKAEIKGNIDTENINRYTTAISEILAADTNQYFSLATQELLESASYDTNAIKYGADASISAAHKFLETLAEMLDNTSLTLEQYNTSAQSILDKRLGQMSQGKTLLDFAGGNLDSSALTSLANGFNKRLDEIVDVTTGEIIGDLGDVLSYNSMSGTYEIQGTFEDFISELENIFNTTIDRKSKEYVNALKNFNDNELKKEHEIDQAVTEELEKLASAKSGDRLNLAQTFTLFDSDTWEKLLAGFNATMVDGILTISNAANIPAIIDRISAAVVDAGQMLPDELAKLNDALKSALSSITNILKNGIAGNLSYSDKNTLEQWASNYGIEGLDFTETKDGFKLAQDSAIELYDQLKLIDGLQAQLVFDELNKSLQESNVHYKGISEIAARIKEIESIPSNVRTEQYERELELAKEIYAVRSTTEDESFNFMSDKIPGGQNNPLNYWNNWNTAWQTIKESSESGFMDYTSFYNMITEMGNLAEKSGTQINLGAENFITGAESAAKLIEEGAGYLSVATDGSIQVDLSKFGANFLSGSAEMQTGVDEGIHKLAKSQVQMLDGMIQLMETVVAMEDLDKISGENKQIDLTDLFPDFTADGQKLQLKQKAADAFADMLSAEDDSDLGKALKAISWSGKNLKEWIVEAKNNGLDQTTAQEFTNVMDAFYKMYLSGDYSLDNIAASIKEVLAGTNFNGELKVGDWHIMVNRGVVLEMNDKGQFLVQDPETGKTTAYDNPDNAAQAQYLSLLNSLSGMEKTYNADGTITAQLGEVTIAASYNMKDGVYTATFQDGGTVTSDTREGLDQAIKQYAALKELSLGESTSGEQSKTSNIQKATITLQKGIVLNTEYDIETGITTITNAQQFSDSEEGTKWIQEQEKKLNANVKKQVQEEKTVTQDIKTGENEVETKIEENKTFAKDNPAEQPIAIYDDGTVYEQANAIRENIEEDPIKPHLDLSPDILYSLQNKINGYPYEVEVEDINDEELAYQIQEELNNYPFEIEVEDMTPEEVEAFQQAFEDNLDPIKIIPDTNPVYEAVDALDLKQIVKLHAVMDGSFSKTGTTKEENLDAMAYDPRYYVENKATGNLGYAKSQGTLMGELGPELVVSNGRYFVVGQNGPEMIDLADDAIVFNHLQTKSLLEKGMSSGRGKAVTNERNAVSFATGNVNGGPAMADASSALAALKQLRAQWKALESLSVADLAKKGGGGGGGGGDDKAFLKELEKWYNWLQKIARLEKEINLEEAKRSKYQSDFKRSGQDFYISQVETLEKLQQEAAVTKSLRDSQQEWFDKRRAEMNAEGNPFTALYTFDEQGQLKYKDGALEKLSYIWGTNNQGKANLSAQEQYEAIVAMDSRFAEFMKYDSSGQEIDQKDYAAMVQAFADKMDSDQTTMQNGWDSIQDLTKQGYELQTKSNELLHAIEDNQIEVENKVLNAIVESRQRAINDAKKERDAIEEASNNLTNGLRDALDKERTMYENQQNADELATLQRRLGILQRSGGSASEIANLQQQITEKQQDTYFDLQEQQIDAIEQASEAELKRLDNQIEIMQSTLDYEKEHGLLWNQVYQELTKSPEEISAFIQQNTSEYWGKSPTELNKVLTSDMFIIDQFKAMQSEAAKSIIGEGYDSLDELIKHYSDEAVEAKAAEETAQANAAAEASAAAAEQTTTTEQGGGGSGNKANNSGGGNSNGKKEEKVKKLDFTTEDSTTIQTINEEGVFTKNKTLTSEQIKAQAKEKAAIKKAAEEKLAATQKAIVNESIVNSIIAGKTVGTEAADKKIKKKAWELVGYPTGGMVEEDGLAYVHAKEGVLKASQVSILRNEILGNKPNSALSILSDLRNQWIQMEQASYTPATQSAGITIENATVEMNVAQIANDYDARRAGEQALSEMMRIARKTAAQNRIG